MNALALAVIEADPCYPSAMDTLTTEFYLAYTTALEGWRTSGPRPVAPHGRERLAQAEAPTAEQLDLALTRLPKELSTPVHLLVPNDSDRRCTDLAVCHACSTAFPSGAFSSWLPGVFLSSPALVYLQLANKLSPVKLIKLGYELCGSFSLAPGTAQGMWSHRPLASVQELRRFIAGCHRPWPTTRASRALDHVIDGAASPMEAAAAMLLTLPRSQGAYNLVHPALNHRIDLDDNARRLTSRSYFVADLCWPDKWLVIEYDSNRHHASGGERCADSEKRNALRAMNYQVISLTPNQLLDPLLFDRVALQVAKVLGVRIRKERYDWDARCRDLRRQLFDEPPPGMEAARAH